jgi:NAD(P)-dependent dehydrogenase (short-subunit alcohol dehydrogenase family)
MEARLAGKVIVVAGGGGIGDALAQRYAAEGASVVLGVLDGDRAAQAAAQISAAGGKAIGTRLDGGDESSIAALVALSVSTYGGIDGFHANFASFQDGIINANILDLPLEVFDDMVRINLRGFVLCTRHAVPELVKRGGGSIVYTSSGAAHSGEPIRAAYSMTKTAGHSLMRHVASAFGPAGVRANSIAPGIIMHKRLEAQVPDGFKEWAVSRIPLKARLGNPTDIAALSALLMSDEGSYITGQVISVDGGATMRL